MTASSAESTELRVSEIFASIQGEGPSAGAPAVFLRLAICNLRCQWCDTRYTWDFAIYDYTREVSVVPVAEVADKLAGLGGDRLVITGGEPLLQQRALVPLLESLEAATTIEIETNGTVAPLPALIARVDQWNVSPKLSSAGDPIDKRIRKSVLETFARTGSAWLKLVIADEADVREGDALVAEIGWPRDRVLFMPEGADRSTLAARTPFVERAARTRGVAVSPRLHVERFDGVRGR